MLFLKYSPEKLSYVSDFNLSSRFPPLLSITHNSWVRSPLPMKPAIMRRDLQLAIFFLFDLFYFLHSRTDHFSLKYGSGEQTCTSYILVDSQTSHDARCTEYSTKREELLPKIPGQLFRFPWRSRQVISATDLTCVSSLIQMSLNLILPS